MKESKETKAMNLTTILMNMGVTEIKYFYYKEAPIGTILTTCVLLDNDFNVLSRGVSMCSLLDNYVKSTGKNKAFGRAVKALRNKTSYYPITLGNRKQKNQLLLDKTYRVSLNDKKIDEIEENLTKHSISKLDKKVIQKENIVVFKCKIPYVLPMLIASNMFKYKSEYNPDLVEEEKVLIERLKSKQK